MKVGTDSKKFKLKIFHVDASQVGLDFMGLREQSNENVMGPSKITDMG